MALGKNWGSNKGSGFLGYVRFSRSFGRKRVGISNDMEVGPSFAAPIKKKQCFGNWDSCSDPKSVIESLPQDVLVRILCGVEHDVLKSLFHVSKSIREATMIAKQWHFAYSTPTKKLAFRNSVEFEDWGDEVEAPNAPKHSRVPKSRLNGKNQGESWPRRTLFLDME